VRRTRSDAQQPARLGAGSALGAPAAAAATSTFTVAGALLSPRPSVAT
jgi:hypothetical protein